MKWHGKQVLLLLLFLMLSIQLVTAENFLDDSFSFLEGTDLGSFYDKHASWVDFAVFLSLFILIARFGLHGKFGDQSGKLGTVFGIMLAIGMTVLESRTGFNIGKLGPLMGIIVAVIFGVCIYKVSSGIGANKLAAFSLATIFAYVIIALLGNTVMADLKQLADNASPENPAPKILYGIMRIMLIVAVFGAIWALIQGVMQLFKGGFVSGLGIGGGLKKVGEAAKKGAETVKEIRSEEGREASEEKREEQEAKRELSDIRSISRLSASSIKDVENIEKALNGIIQLIERTKGRLTPESYSQLQEEFRILGSKDSEIKNITKDVHMVIVDLERVEEAERLDAQRATVNARIEAENARRTAEGRHLTRDEMNKFTDAQLKIENDIKVQSGRAWAATRTEMEKLEKEVEALEVEFDKVLKSAVPLINPTQWNQAVNRVKEAQQMLGKLAKALKLESGKASNDVRKLLQRELKDFKQERNMIARINALAH